VIYRFSKLMAMEAKLLRLDRKIRFISLPNIFLERAAVPELIGDAASPAAIRAQLEALKDDGPARQAQLEAFRQLNQLLGPSDCIPKTAELAVAMAQRVLRP
jgi:lipid A disaccharide synthetase